MEKRAQVTTYVILGIVIIAVIAAFFYARNVGFGVSPERFLSTKKTSIEDRVEECIELQASRVLDTIGKQGGTLSPLRFEMFRDSRVNYLCYNIPLTDICVNRVLTLKNMETEISRYLENNLANCIKLNDFRASGMSLQPGNLEVSTNIGQSNVLVVVDYPITLEKENARLTLSRFSSTVNVPLGNLYLAAIDIIDSEAKVGEFDQLPYMLVHNNVRIEKQRPYPDKVYILSHRLNPYIFQFAIEGEQ